MEDPSIQEVSVELGPIKLFLAERLRVTLFTVIFQHKLKVITIEPQEEEHALDPKAWIKTEMGLLIMQSIVKQRILEVLDSLLQSIPLIKDPMFVQPDPGVFKTGFEDLDFEDMGFEDMGFEDWIVKMV